MIRNDLFWWHGRILATLHLCFTVEDPSDSQIGWHHSHNEGLFAALFATFLMRPRLAVVAAPHSGAFLPPCWGSAHIWTRHPSKLQLQFDSVHLSVHYTCAICGALVGCIGLHGLSCRKSSGRITRHSAINGLIKIMATAKDWRDFRQCLGQKVNVWDPSLINHVVLGAGIFGSDEKALKSALFFLIAIETYLAK